MKNHIGNSNVRTNQRSRWDRMRKLQMERLEGRQLMAVDFSNHNGLIAEDVNQDFRVSPVDALYVINFLNDRASASAEGENSRSKPSLKWDVSGDGRLSPLDALLIINRLNGEGEDTPLLAFSYSITDPTSGNPITQVAVGSDFQVNVFVQDLRPENSRPTNDDGKLVAGAFTVAMDLGVSSLSLADYIRPTTFRSGIQYVTSNFSLQRVGYQGGGIQLGTGDVPEFSDGQTFSLTSTAGKVTFEFDTNSSVTNGNVAVTLPTGTVIFSEFGNAIVSAVNGSTLGITSSFNGQTVVNLPTNTTLDIETSKLAVSDIRTDFFDEVAALSSSSFEPPDDPLAVKGFYSVKFKATNPGTLTFTPNAPDTPESENGLYSVPSEPDPAPSPLPNNLINFGQPFSLAVITDPTGPRVTNDTLPINEDETLTIDNAVLLSNDTSGATPPRALTVNSVQVIAGTTKGTLASGVYTPPQDFNGQDFLTYTVRDTSGLSATGTITINVAPVNDAPVANNDNLVATLGIENTLNVLANDTAGPTNESSQVIIVSAVGTPANGTVRIPQGGASVIYTPNTGFVGTDTFTYTIRDNGNPQLTDTATVTVNVAPPTRPFAIGDTQTVVEDSTNNRIDVLANDLSNAGRNKVLVAIGTNPTKGTATIDNNGTPADASDDTILYTPTGNVFGTDFFTYSMNETGGTGANSLATVAVTITNVNDRPTLVNDLVQGGENTTLNIPFGDLTTNDSPGPGETDTLTITSVSAVTANAGTVAINGTNVVYTPLPSFSGTFLFTYLARDNGTPQQTAAAAATVTINVNPFNDPPVIANDTVAGTEDINVTIAATTLLTNDSPGPGEASQTLTISSVTAVTANAGTVQLVGTNVVYTPARDFNGPFLFTYVATDNGIPAKTGTATVTVNMAAVNDVPVATTDSLRAFKNNVQRIPFSQVLGNDTTGAANEASQTLTVTAVQAGTNGTVSLDAANGVILFTPATDFIGDGHFTYTVQDNGGGTTNSATGRVNVKVEEFLPSLIRGTVWIDETLDGQISQNERFLGGVKVRLTGTSLGQTITPQTALTLSDGTYQFAELGPGSYQVTFDSPMYSKASSFFATPTYNLNIAEPGGFNRVQNYSIFGINASMVTKLGRLMDQLVSQHHFATPEISLRGAYFALGSNNEMKWGLKLDGFKDALYTEAVLDGNNLLLTVVEADHSLHTATISPQFYRLIEDEAGNKLIRLIGEHKDFTWGATSRANPAFTAQNYLASVDALFDQRGWTEPT